MPTKRIDIHEAPEWIAELKGEMKKAALKGLYAAALRVVHTIQQEVIPSINPMPVDRGAYRAAWKAEKLEEGALVTNTMPYAAVIEYGARAQNIKIGRKLIDALTDWVRRKGIGGGTTAKGRPRKPTAGEARAIAWAIAKSMQKRGIFGPDGLRVLEKGTKNVSKFIEEEVDRELKKLG
jgi:hypothetical protein